MLSLFNRLKPKLAKEIETPEAQESYKGRAYVIGDVHGCLHELVDLLKEIYSDIATNPHPKPKIIFLGDLVDRGPYSKEVIEFLLAFEPKHVEMVYLIGNHEEIFLDIISGNSKAVSSWFEFGGRSCARSYGVENLGEVYTFPDKIAQQLAQNVPQSHFEFISGFKDYYVEGPYLCVHAGIAPGVPLKRQKPKDMRWIRKRFLDSDRDHGHIIIHGHTIVETPEIHPNRIAVDTGAYKNARLTAARLDATGVSFIQSAIIETE